MSLKKTFALCAALFCALTALVFALDHLCLTLVGEGEKTLVKGVIGLRLVKNSGAAFSFLSGKAFLANALSAVILIALTAFLLFGKMCAPARLSLCACLSGGACNLYMRLLRGGVNDWIELKFVDFPVFNFADVCVCLGAAAFVLCVLVKKDG